MSLDKGGTVPQEIDKFARAQAMRLLGKLAFEVRHTAKHPDEEAIHDLRVSIRRFSQCLREFHDFFPKRKVHVMLKQLKEVMDLAAEMRNRDIAIELIGKGTSTVGPEIVPNLMREREEAKQKLTTALVRWRRHDFSRKWRSWLVL